MIPPGSIERLKLFQRHGSIVTASYGYFIEKITSKLGYHGYIICEDHKLALEMFSKISKISNIIHRCDMSVVLNTYQRVKIIGPPEHDELLGLDSLNAIILIVEREW
jgi:hypothetical protein